MKLATYLAILAFSAALICMFGLAKAGTTNSAAQPTLMLLSTNSISLLKNPLLLQVPALPILESARVKPQIFPHKPLDGKQTPLFDFLPKLNQQLLKPGVWQTEPYSCIVVVPGPHPDDRALIARGETKMNMPIIRPELRFIPREAEKK
jgi:hypothetical protein